MNENKCTNCNKKLKEGEGRFNYPKGARCVKCGVIANDYLKKAEKYLDEYAEITGYRPRIRF